MPIVWHDSLTLLVELPEDGRVRREQRPWAPAACSVLVWVAVGQCVVAGPQEPHRLEAALVPEGGLVKDPQDLGLLSPDQDLVRPSLWG